MGSLAIYEYEGSFGTTIYLDAISLSKFREYVGGADESDVVIDDDAEDIDIPMATADVSTAVEEVESKDKPRV